MRRGVIRFLGFSPDLGITEILAFHGNVSEPHFLFPTTGNEMLALQTPMVSKVVRIPSEACCEFILTNAKTEWHVLGKAIVKW